MEKEIVIKGDIAMLLADKKKLDHYKTRAYQYGYSIMIPIGMHYGLIFIQNVYGDKWGWVTRKGTILSYGHTNESGKQYGPKSVISGITTIDKALEYVHSIDDKEKIIDKILKK